MIERKISKEEIDKIVELLSRSSLFRTLKVSYLKELATSMKMFFCEGGETVIKQGEPSSGMYLIYSGMLRVYQSVKNEVNLISELSTGHIFGEISLLSEKARIATVIACRDSILLKLEEDTYRKFEQNYPSIALQISKQAIIRLVEDKKRKNIVKEADIKTIAIVPAGDSNHRAFVQYLYTILSALKPTIVITKELCDKQFGSNIAQTELDERHYAQLSSWFQSLENEYGFLIYESDRQMTPWTKRCLRHADRILLIAEEQVYPALNSIEMNIFSKEWAFHSSIELIFLHESSNIKDSMAWLKSRPVQGFHHLQLNSEKDTAKFIRFLTGKSIGVVLTGGGARGFAHIGFLKALEEKNIPIDYIAGTSMGALVAAGNALGMSVAEVIDFAHNFAYRSQYTLPVVALTTGKYLVDMLQALCGDVMIEDLHKRFFCVSTNITEGKLRIQDSGPMWLAIRSSLSVPGIFPPIYDSVGNMLVDGGILNNMPVDILRKKMYRGEVFCVRCFAKEEKFKKNINPNAWASGWKLLLQKFLRGKSPSYDSMGSIILEAMNVGSKNFEKSVEDQADYLVEFDTSAFQFLEFEKADAIIDLGYRSSLEALSHFDLPENNF